MGAQAHRALGSLINSHTPGAHPAQDPAPESPAAPGLSPVAPPAARSCLAPPVQAEQLRALPGKPGARSPWPCTALPLDPWQTPGHGTLWHSMVSRGHGRRTSGILIPGQILKEWKVLGNRSPAGFKATPSLPLVFVQRMQKWGPIGLRSYQAVRPRTCCITQQPVCYRLLLLTPAPPSHSSRGL